MRAHDTRMVEGRSGAWSRGGFDFSAFGGGAVALPLDDAPTAIAAVAWAETDKRYNAERAPKLLSRWTGLNRRPTVYETF